jgi:hypothetical protein
MIAVLSVLIFSFPLGAAADENTQNVLDSWTPATATAERWRPAGSNEISGIKVSPTSVCGGHGRQWISEDSPTRITLIWRTCPRGAMPLLVTNLPELFGYTIAPDVASALPEDADRVVLLPTGHTRQWLQDDRLIDLTTECQTREREACTAFSAAAAKDLATMLPGQPDTHLPNSGPVIQTALKATLIALGAMVIIIPFVRRLRTIRHRGTSGDDRWTPVDAAARTLRHDAATRRWWLGTLWVTASMSIFLLAGPIFSSDATFSLASVGPSVLFAIFAGYRTLRSTNHPLLRRDWLRHGRTTKPALRNRLFIGALNIFAGAVIMTVLTLIANVVTYDWYSIHLTDLERAVITVVLILLLILAFLGARHAHRVELRGAWQFLNNVQGVPFTFLRQAADDSIRMRRTAMIRRNGAIRFFDWIRLRPLGPFAPTIALLLARHGKVLALDPPHQSLGDTGAATIRLPLQDVVARAQAARGVLLLAPTGTEDQGWPLPAIPEDPATACVLLIIPPWTNAEFDGRFTAFKALATGHPLLRELAAPWVSPATLVLAHVPGLGWRGWGAKDRTDWTYTEALESALAFASPRWDLTLAERARRVPTDAEFDSRPKVFVHASSAGVDTEVSALIREGLAEMGVNVLQSPQTVTKEDSVVTVMSNAALRDAAWQTTSAELAENAKDLIPVVVEQIEGDPPDHLATPNWTYWTAGPATALAKLFDAINSNASTFRKHRDLVSQARTWHDRGRPKHLLISQRERAEDAARHVEQVERDVLAKPDALTRDYVRASVARSSNLRRRLPWWAAAICVVLTVTGFAVKVTLDDARLRNKNNTIGVIVSTYSMPGMNNPGYLGLQAAALVLQGQGDQKTLGRQALMNALNEKWPLNFLGSEHDAQLIDVAVTDGSSVFTIDVAGTLTRWDVGSARATARHFVATGLTRLATTADGGLIVAAEQTKLHLIKPEPWHDEVIDLPGTVSRVALAPKTNEITVALTDGRLMSAASGKPLRTIGTYRNILSVQSTEDGDSRALVVPAPGSLSVIDPATGSVTGTSRVELPSFNMSGALGSDGQTVAVVDSDRRIRFGPLGDLRPAGQFVPDTVDGLVVMSPTAFLFASAQFGTQVYDAGSRMITARLVSPEPGATLIRVPPKGGLIATYAGNVVFVWHPFGLTSTPEPSVVQNKGTTVQSTQHGVHAAGTPRGELVLGGDRTIQAVTGPVTAIAVGDDGRSILVGSGRGEVAEVDADPGVVVRRWQAPDNAAIKVVGWAKRPEQLLIETVPGRWWTTEACNGCGSDATLIAAFRDRMAGCYRPNNVEQITEAVQRTLNLRLCQQSPRAEVH